MPHKSIRKGDVSLLQAMESLKRTSQNQSTTRMTSGQPGVPHFRFHCRMMARWHVFPKPRTHASQLITHLMALQTVLRALKRSALAQAGQTACGYLSRRTGWMYSTVPSRRPRRRRGTAGSICGAGAGKTCRRSWHTATSVGGADYALFSRVLAELQAG